VPRRKRKERSACGGGSGGEKVFSPVSELVLEARPVFIAKLPERPLGSVA
jgi:hypothetical protein